MIHRYLYSTRTSWLRLWLARRCPTPFTCFLTEYMASAWPEAPEKQNSGPHCVHHGSAASCGLMSLFRESARRTSSTPSSISAKGSDLRGAAAHPVDGVRHHKQRSGFRSCGAGRPVPGALGTATVIDAGSRFRAASALLWTTQACSTAVPSLQRAGTATPEAIRSTRRGPARTTARPWRRFGLGCARHDFPRFRGAYHWVPRRNRVPVSCWVGPHLGLQWPRPHSPGPDGPAAPTGASVRALTAAGRGARPRCGSRWRGLGRRCRSAG